MVFYLAGVLTLLRKGKEEKPQWGLRYSQTTCYSILQLVTMVNKFLLNIGMYVHPYIISIIVIIMSVYPYKTDEWSTWRATGASQLPKCFISPEGLKRAN